MGENILPHNLWYHVQITAQTVIKQISSRRSVRYHCGDISVYSRSVYLCMEYYRYLSYLELHPGSYLQLGIYLLFAKCANTPRLIHVTWYLCYKLL